jgi:hypothetical protein
MVTLAADPAPRHAIVAYIDGYAGFPDGQFGADEAGA